MTLVTIFVWNGILLNKLNLTIFFLLNQIRFFL